MKYLILLLSILICSCSTKQKKVGVFIESKYPQTEFAISNASELFSTDLLQRIQNKEEADLTVSVAEDNEFLELKHEGFILKYISNGKFKLMIRKIIYCLTTISRNENPSRGEFSGQTTEMKS